MTASNAQQEFAGVLVLDKPPGISSARAVDAVKRLLPRGTKVGHAGTLDPFATGVLLVLVGRATKSCEALMDQPKTYEATVKLGATTETDDPESPEVPSPRPGRGLCAREEVERALQNFVGEIQQRPPAYSAIKIDGRRACDRVRDGQQIELRPRRVRVYSIDLLDYTWPLAKLRVDCGRGTYIRSIARDLGEVLQTGGYLTELRRTRIGLFSIEQAVTIDKLTRDDFASVLRPIPQLI